ncbi:MAG: EamA family transporter [Gammaproteobacteria bacterium]|nr:EamA family transporter [Gammaproteobacteria bacterium]
MNLSVLVLLFVTLVWGTTFPVIQAATAHLNGAEITALRFLIAGVCMLPFAVKASCGQRFAQCERGPNCLCGAQR